MHMKKVKKRTIPILRPKTGKKVKNNEHIMMEIGNDVFLLYKFLKMKKEGQQNKTLRKLFCYSSYFRFIIKNI